MISVTLRSTNKQQNNNQNVTGTNASLGNTVIFKIRNKIGYVVLEREKTLLSIQLVHSGN